MDLGFTAALPANAVKNQFMLHLSSCGIEICDPSPARIGRHQMRFIDGLNNTGICPLVTNPLVKWTWDSLSCRVNCGGGRNQ